jgi:acyl carrier protein
MYRTGDLARWRADGVIEFLGRADSQVKILGHRIEPGEIESVLGTHEHIKQSCVVPRTEEDGSKRLIAYYVCSGSHVTAANLRTFLAKKIPGYMIPAIFVPVASLPLTPNGKIDRAALPEPSTAVRPDSSAKAAATQLEQTIIDIWHTYLSTEQLGPTANFFDVGGDSLSLMRVHTRLQKAIEVQIPITALFEYATVRSLAQYLSGHVSSEASISDARQRAQKQRAAFAAQHRRKNGSAL